MKADSAIPTDYVVCATLSDVPDVFNVENLWGRARRRGRQNQFLMEALIHHPRTRKSRHRLETFFHHVIVRIPASDYARDERVDDGFNRAALIQDLIRLHTEKFGNLVPEGEAVRYRVEADRALPTGQVCFLFGRAIYLPGDEEQPKYWLYQQDERRRTELGVIYPGQRLTLLNGDAYASTFPVPNWPFGNQSSVLLIVKPNQAPTVCAEPDGCLPVGSSEERLFWIGDFATACLYLRLEPQPLGDADQLNEPLTWTPGGEPSRAGSRLRVIGIALQRPSLHAKAGLRSWRLGFDRRGALVGCRHPSAVAWLRIDDEDRLWGEAADGVAPLEPGAVWRPHEELALELGVAPEIMSPHYRGWVRLPRPIPLSVPAGRWLCFGRGAEVDLAPGLLNDPDALVWDEARDVRPEQLGLSRRHLGLRLDADGNRWTLKLESETWPAYQLIRSGESGRAVKVEERGRESAIEPGAWLVVGGYVLETG